MDKLERDSKKTDGNKSSVEVPRQYAMMKFCEKFHLSPLEYYQLPTRLVSLWNTMSIIEESKRK